jgi:hypothetical protein
MDSQAYRDALEKRLAIVEAGIDELASLNGNDYLLLWAATAVLPAVLLFVGWWWV